MCIPFSGNDAVAVAAFQFGRYRTLTLVDDDAVILVHVSQYVVTGDGMTTFGHDIFLLQGIFRQFENLFGVDFFLFLRFFFLLLFILIIAKRESQILHPVAALFLFQFIFVGISQNDGFVTDGYKKLFFVLHVMQFAQLLDDGCLRADLFFLKEFIQQFFSFFLEGFSFLTQNSRNLSSCTRSSGKHFPLGLYTL